MEAMSKECNDWGARMFLRISRALSLTADVLANIGRETPDLLNREQTLIHALEKGCSISRFGDGELGLAFSGTTSESRGIHFQKYDRKLSERLTEILMHPDESVLVCFNNAFTLSAQQHMVLDYEPSRKPYQRCLSLHRQDDVGLFRRKGEHRSYKRYLRKLNGMARRPVMGDATCFVLGLFFQEYLKGRIPEICDLYRRFFNGRRVLFVCPDKPLHGASFRHLVKGKVIMSPKEIAFLTVPDRNCFDHYDHILKEILKHERVNTVFIQAGPAATVLAADLAVNHGLTAYDVGSFNISLGKAAERHGFTF
jgi:hypothetical protein